MNYWSVLRKELDRIEGKIFDFGRYEGWAVEKVSRVNPGYLYWCGLNVKMRPDLMDAVLHAMRRVRREFLSRRNRTLVTMPCSA